MNVSRTRIRAIFRKELQEYRRNRSLVAGMAMSGVMTPAIAFALLAAYFMVASECFLGTHALGVFRMSFASIGPTELRIILAVGAIKVAISPWVEIAGWNDRADRTPYLIQQTEGERGASAP